MNVLLDGRLGMLLGGISWAKMHVRVDADP